MRNTVYVLARDHGSTDIEAFGLALAERFLAAPRVERATVSLVEHPWERVDDHDHSFTRAAGGERTAVVVRYLACGHARAGGGVRARRAEDHRLGVRGVPARRAHDAAGDGRPDPGHHGRGGVGLRGHRAEWSRLWAAVRDRLQTAFTDHYSPSVQYTLYRMGRAVLDGAPEVVRVEFELPNRHHLLVDLEPFGLHNENTVFHVTSEPYGLMRGTLERA